MSVIGVRIRESLTRFSRYAMGSRALDYLVLLIFAVVVTKLWLVGRATPIGGDFAAIPFHPSQILSRYSSAWNFWIDGGNPIPSIISNQVSPVDLLFYYTLAAIGFPITWIQTIYVILFSYYLGAISSYLLVRILFETRVPAVRLAAIIAGMFYVLNPIAVYSSGYVFILGSALPRASLPLSLYFLIAGVRKRDLRYAIALSLASVLMFTVFARAIELGFFLLISVALALSHIPQIVRERDISVVKFTAKFSTVSAITAAAANLFWIVPFAWNYQFFQDELTNFPTTFVNAESQFNNLINVIRLQGNWTLFVGTYVPYASYFSQPAVVVATFAIPALAIVGLQRWRKQNPEIHSLGFVLSLCVALGLGTNLPFNIFQTIMGIPFLKLFKDPWIFMEPLSLIYSIFFGLSLSYIYRFIMVRIRMPNFTKMATLGLAFLILGTVSLPVLTGDVYTNWYQPSQKGVLIPSQYTQLNSWLQQHPCDCQTMIVPEFAGTYIATSWGYQGSNILYQNLLTNSLVTGYGPAIYGIQPGQSKTLIDYIYTLMSRGNPLSSPYPINETTMVQDWHYPSSSQDSSDSLVALNTTDPWGESSLNWNFSPLNKSTQNGQEIFYQSSVTMDLSDRHWVLLWAKSTVGWSNFAFGIGDSSTTGWYTMSSHILESQGAWSLFAFPAAYPDAFYYNSSRSWYFVLNYGRFADPSLAALGNGVLSLGAVNISSGTVSENAVRFFLQTLNVKYMVLDSSLDGNLYSYLDLRPYLESFSNWTSIQPVATFGTLTVYENPSQASLVSMPAYWFHAPSLYSVPAKLDQMASQPNPGSFIVSTGGDSKPIISDGAIQSVTRVGAAQFVVRASVAGSSLLVLSTAFDPSWQATTNNGAVLNHTLVNAYANGWFLQGNGDITITITDSRQTLYQASILVSIIVIIVACALVSMKLRLISKRVKENHRATVS